MPIDPKDIDVTDYEPDNEEEEAPAEEAPEVAETETPDDEVDTDTSEEATPAPEEGQPAGDTEATPKKYGDKFGDDADKLWNAYQEIEKFVGSKFGGLTFEQLQDMRTKAQQWESFASGLPPKDGEAQPSKKEVNDLIKASGLDFDNVDWDNLDSAGFGSLLKDSLQKMGAHLLSTMQSTVPTVMQEQEEIRKAELNEINEGIQLDPRLDSDQLFRDRVADKIEIAAANGREMTVAEAVVEVQKEYQQISSANNQATRSENEVIDKGTKDTVPKTAGGSKPIGDRPKTARDAISESIEETNFDFGNE